MEYRELAHRFETLLGLQKHAVAMAFVDSAPKDLPRVTSSGPASCSYWKLANDGGSFYTTAEDHLNCTIGAYTHGVAMPPEKSAELKFTIGKMIELNYLSQEEVPEIPHRNEPFQVAVYSPLADCPCEPAVVIVRGNAKHLMLLTEASLAAGIGPQGGTMARPTCAFIPDTIRSGRTTPSFACIGNRVYTGLANDELYVAIPGFAVAKVTAALETIVGANQALESYHQARCA
jgi:uncharacterized protein (DUF169 family)